VTRSRAAGNDIEIVVYNGATHDFDDPSVRRQRVEANAEAARDAFTRARNFVGQLFAAEQTDRPDLLPLSLQSAAIGAQVAKSLATRFSSTLPSLRK
jgi:hypothetical protein